MRSLWPMELVITFISAVSASSSSAIRLYELGSKLPATEVTSIFSFYVAEMTSPPLRRADEIVACAACLLFGDVALPVIVFP